LWKKLLEIILRRERTGLPAFRRQTGFVMIEDIATRGDGEWKTAICAD
jgi:hypothetical protein